MSNVQNEVVLWSINNKVPIGEGVFTSVGVLKQNLQVNLLSCGEAVDIAKSIPKFSVEISKTMFVFIPSIKKLTRCEVSDFLLSMMVHPPMLQRACSVGTLV